jgi:hypothetical protein
MHTCCWCVSMLEASLEGSLIRLNLLSLFLGLHVLVKQELLLVLGDHFSWVLGKLLGLVEGVYTVLLDWKLEVVSTWWVTSNTDTSLLMSWDFLELNATLAYWWIMIKWWWCFGLKSLFLLLILWSLEFAISRWWYLTIILGIKSSSIWVLTIHDNLLGLSLNSGIGLHNRCGHLLWCLKLSLEYIPSHYIDLLNCSMTTIWLVSCVLDVQLHLVLIGCACLGELVCWWVEGDIVSSYLVVIGGIFHIRLF